MEHTVGHQVTTEVLPEHPDPLPRHPDPLPEQLLHAMVDRAWSNAAVALGLSRSPTKALPKPMPQHHSTKPDGAPGRPPRDNTKLTQRSPDMAAPDPA